MTLLNRILNPNVSLKSRVRQSTNGLITALFCEQLSLTHVVEFPKSGGSWIRNMIRTYLALDMFSGDRLLRKNDVVLTHSLYRPTYKRVVIVVRDPRDIYVSFYYYETVYENKAENLAIERYFRRDSSRTLQEDFAAYLAVKLKIRSHPWFYYRDFLNAWVDRSDVCVVRYEDCLQNPQSELTRILEFVDQPIDLDRVKRTIEETSFANVTKSRYGEQRDPGQADNRRFHRKGIAGDWKNHFNESSCCLLEEFEGHSLRRLGYEPDDKWVKRFRFEVSGRSDARFPDVLQRDTG